MDRHFYRPLLPCFVPLFAPCKSSIAISSGWLDKLFGGPAKWGATTEKQVGRNRISYF